MGVLEITYTKKRKERTSGVDKVNLFVNGSWFEMENPTLASSRKTTITLRPTVEVRREPTEKLLEKVKRGEIAVIEVKRYSLEGILYVSLEFLEKRAKGLFSYKEEERTYPYFGTLYKKLRRVLAFGIGENRAEFLNYKLLKKERVGYEVVKKNLDFTTFDCWGKVELKTKGSDNTFTLLFTITGKNGEFFLDSLNIVDSDWFPASKEEKEKEKEYWKEQLKKDFVLLFEEIKSKLWENFREIDNRVRKFFGKSPEVPDRYHYFEKVAEMIEKKYGIPISDFYAGVLFTDKDFYPYAKEILERVKEKTPDYYKGRYKIKGECEDGCWGEAFIDPNDPIEWGAFVVSVFGRGDLVVEKTNVKDGKVEFSAFV